MSTPRNDTALVFETPDQIAYYRITVIKGALKKEVLARQHGFSLGRALRPQLAKEFGLKPRDSHDKYIAYCETQQAILLAKRPTQKEQ